MKEKPGNDVLGYEINSKPKKHIENKMYIMVHHASNDKSESD